MDEYYLPISALQHYAYCPRQFALIHIEKAWEENYFTADGRRLHERVDSGVEELRRGVRYERSVLLISHRFMLNGKADLLEIHEGEPTHFLPVEYKRGKSKLEDWDRIQLCAQALCIEEMWNVQVEKGSLWYWETRHREMVEIDKALRDKTIDTIESAHLIWKQGITPKPTENKRRCKACSLSVICQPSHFLSDYSARYLEEIFLDEKIT